MRDFKVKMEQNHHGSILFSLLSLIKTKTGVDSLTSR